MAWKNYSLVWEFLQRETAGTSYKWFVAMSNERVLQQATSDTVIYLRQATSVTSKKQILQRAMSDFTTSNKEKVNFNE